MTSHAGTHTRTPSGRLRIFVERWTDRERRRSQLWLLPTIAAFGAILVAEVMLAVDDRLAESTRGLLVFRGTVDGAQAVLATIATSMLSFIGVVFSVSVVAVYLASSQFSPRVLRQFTRDRVNQVVLAIFSATFTYTIVVLGSIDFDDRVGDVVAPRVSVSVAFLLTFVSLLAFLVYVHHITQSIRAAHIIERVAREARAAIRRNYPDPLRSTGDSPLPDLDGEPLLVVSMLESGVVAGLDESRLLSLGERTGCTFRLIPALGSYVPSGLPLMEVYERRAGARPPTPEEIFAFVGIDVERTVQDDVAFGFRQLIDIAERALSPAINDPTTAVQVIDRVHDLLHQLAGREVPEHIVQPPSGAPILVYQAMSWDDFVGLAFNELRHDGARSLPVVRRLNASIESLLVTIPDATRRRPVEVQRALLDRARRRHFTDAVELRLASGADALGTGDTGT